LRAREKSAAPHGRKSQNILLYQLAARRMVTRIISRTWRKNIESEKHQKGDMAT